MSNNADRQQRFNELVGQYTTDLYRYGLWLCGSDALAKDLVQETCLRAWKALDSLQEPKAAKGWLITILRREYARTFERKVPPISNIDDVVVADGENDEPEQRVERRLLREGMQQLPRKYREPLLLQIVMGYSCAEIAEELELSKSAVMTQLFRAREMLKATLQDDGITGNTDGP